MHRGKIDCSCFDRQSDCSSCDNGEHKALRSESRLHPVVYVNGVDELTFTAFHVHVRHRVVTDAPTTVPTFL